MAGETGGPEDRYLMLKAVERELKEMKNSIKVQRAMHDMTQQELADRVGVSRQTINAVELGKYVPSAVLAMKVAAAFGRRRSSRSKRRIEAPRTGCRTVIGKTFGLLWDGRERDMPYFQMRHVPSCVDCRRIAGVGGFGLLYM